MWFGAEFQRNLWLQLSWGRVVAAPMLIGIIVAALLHAAEPSPGRMAEFARWGFIVLMALWSTRRVADTLAEEVGGGTWESQRMSGLSAWSMVWGKLFGGASFPWYCGLICLGLIAWYGLQVPSASSGALVQRLAALALGAVLGQATALVVALLLLRKAQFRRRLAVTMAQIAGLLAFGVAAAADHSPGLWAERLGAVWWYGREYDAGQFHLASAGIFTLWALLAAWRLMRAELLYVNRPWLWKLFTLFCMAYAAGFVAWETEVLTSRLAVACLAALVLTYVGFLAEAKDPVRYRWGLARFAALHWWRALEFMPWWLISYVLAVAAGVATIWSLANGGQLAEGAPWWFRLLRDAKWAALEPVAFNFAALLLFVLRDMLFLLWLNFSGRFRGRADLAGLVVLVIAYWPLPMLLVGAGLSQLLPAVFPFAVTNAAAVAWPAAEVAVMAVLLFLRWRRAARIEIVADDRDEPSTGAR